MGSAQYKFTKILKCLIMGSLTFFSTVLRLFTSTSLFRRLPLCTHQFDLFCTSTHQLYFDLNLTSTFLAKLYSDQNFTSTRASRPIRNPDLTKNQSEGAEVKSLKQKGRSTASRSIAVDAYHGSF